MARISFWFCRVLNLSHLSPPSFIFLALTSLSTLVLLPTFLFQMGYGKVELVWKASWRKVGILELEDLFPSTSIHMDCGPVMKTYSPVPSLSWPVYFIQQKGSLIILLYNVP